MYSDQDLNNAVKEGILSKQSVDNFRQFIQKTRNTTLVDEENFKLLTSFNDIFVLIACGLLLLCSYILVFSSSRSFALTGIIITGISWLLAEFFVIKRKMALPGIALLISFLNGLATICLPKELNQLFDINFGLV